MNNRILVTLIAVLALVAGGQVCAQVFPTVELTTFGPVTGTYVYTVTCPANSTYPFGYLQIDTLAANAAPNGPWSIQGPFVNGGDQNWPKSSRSWQTGKDCAVWDPMSKGQVIPANTYWQGTFILVVPDSLPAPGKAATKDGQIGSYKVHDILVPEPKPITPPGFSPPVTTIDLDGTLGNNDWFTSEVTVTLSATDADSDPLSILTDYSLDGGTEWLRYDQPFTIVEDGPASVLAQSEDPAGNLEDPPVSASLKIDKTAPAISGSATGTPNSNGWYSSDVTVKYTAMDITSGLETPLQADPGAIITFNQTVASEGLSVSDSATATDKAGNTGSAGVDGLKIDKTPPVITVNSAPTGNCHLINYEAVTVQFSAVDAISGINGLPTATINVIPTEGWATPSTLLLDAAPVSGSLYEVTFVPSVPGMYNVGISASDLAGNTGQSAASVDFGTGGFNVDWLPPISTMDVYYMADGSTVPVKFRLLDPCNNNAYVSAYEFRMSVVNDATGEVMVPPTVPNRDPSTNVYHLNVKTKRDTGEDWPLGSYTVVISGPGIWDIISGPYKSKYGLLLLDRAVAKGSGKK